MEPDVLDYDDVCSLLKLSLNQLTTLIDGGEIRAISGGPSPGTWAIAYVDFDAFVQRKFSQTRDFIAAHPYAGGHLAEQLASLHLRQRHAPNLSGPAQETRRRS